MESTGAAVAQQNTLEVNGTKFHHVKDQLMGGAVFVDEDKRLYLRTGTEKQVLHEVKLTKELYERGFPVPELVAHGELPDGKFFYTERAIGEKVFGEIFMDETREYGVVRDRSFEELITVMEQYAAAQFSKENALEAPHSLDEILSIENVLRNNPPSETERERFDSAYTKASERIKVLPWTHVQGDLNAFNILPGGVIDFELSGYGPAGFDVVGNVYFGAMWPKERIVYVFSDEQIAEYMRRVDGVAESNGLPPMSDYLEEFLLLKLIWATMMDKDSEDNPGKHPEFWRWRTNVRNWAVEQYLAGQPIDHHQFEVVGSCS